MACWSTSHESKGKSQKSGFPVTTPLQGIQALKGLISGWFWALEAAQDCHPGCYQGRWQACAPGGPCVAASCIGLRAPIKAYYNFYATTISFAK
jgi:hypothetical protein